MVGISTHMTGSHISLVSTVFNASNHNLGEDDDTDGACIIRVSIRASRVIMVIMLMTLILLTTTITILTDVVCKQYECNIV